ncbi:CsbD family protein [Aeromicrobium sp. Leaf350]|uniref:CsbD family protein n=1 Tax=Aeromicrobium sp. Leaf350 TaxID=2876565 RepID=UPI00351D0BD0
MAYTVSRTGSPPVLPTRRSYIMGIVDKAKNTAEKLAGQAKEAVGDATNNDDLKAEGKKDQAKGSIKNAGEDVKDAFKK